MPPDQRRLKENWTNKTMALSSALWKLLVVFRRTKPDFCLVLRHFPLLPEPLCSSVDLYVKSSASS